MVNIIAGDHGTIIRLTITDEGAAVDLRGTTVEVVIKNGDRRLTKTAAITDGEDGMCEVVLTADDTVTPGSYAFQATVRMQNGNIFSSDVQKFPISAKL
jgi:hypothetical protein